VTTTVLAYFPSPAQGVWYLGPFPIRAYALCIIAGIIAALVIGDRRWVARGGERGVIYDIALWAVPFGLIGGRLYHLLTDWKTYFGPGGAGIGAAARIWEGGLGIWGAVALGAVGAWIGCRRKGIPLPAFGDAVAPGVVLAQAIGRLGNYFNQELYGRETTVPWGMEIFYRRDSSGVVDVHSLDGVSTGQVAAVVHPTFLYELLWNLLVFVFLIWADRRFRLGHGRLFALYVAAYCVGRFGVELMRDDTATHIAGIRVNVFTAVFVFIGALVYFLLAPKGREDPATLRGRQPLDAPHEESLDAPHEESLVEEWAEDLVAAAKGSGIVAAATVAGEHETEDSAAVGDIAFETDGEKTEFIVPVETEFSEDEVSETEVSEDEVDGVSEDVVDGVEHPVDDEVVVVYESPAADETETVVVYESEADDDSDADVVVIDDDSAADRVIVDDAESGVVEETEAELVVEDAAVVEAADAELVVDDVETADEVESVDVAAPEPEPEPEPEPKPELKLESAVEVHADVEPDDPESDEDAPQPKVGKTLKRLLWGEGSVGKD
jgi:prolipoprotein diacylglyceryl transferase